MTLHFGHLLVEALADAGVRRIFGVPGGQTWPLYNALARPESAIKHVLMADETNAGFAADGLARVTDRVAVCDATAGPGAARLVPALLESFSASIPVIAITSDVGSSDENLLDRARVSQAMDVKRVLGPIVKRVFTVPSRARLEELVDAAVLVATTGRPGPVVLNIPEDVFGEAWDGSRSRRPSPGHGTYPRFRPAAAAEGIAAAAALLSRSERPLLLVGGGGMISRAWAEVQELADTWGLAVATTLSGKGIIAEDHRMSLGVFGSTGVSSAVRLGKTADLVILVGFKSGQNSTLSWTFPRSNQKVIHIDIDPEELGRVFATDVAIAADAREALRSLIDVLPAHPQCERTEWSRKVELARLEWGETMARESAAGAGAVKPQAIVRCLQGLLGEDDLLVGDASFASGWAGLYYQQKRAGRRVVLPRGAGGLGYGLPAAIGCSFSGRFERVVALVGDGAFLYSLGELATLARNGLPITIVVISNGILGWVDHVGRTQFDGAAVSTEIGRVDFASVARDLGLRAARVDTSGDLDDALAGALRGDGPALVDVTADPRESPIFGLRRALAARAPGGG